MLAKSTIDARRDQIFPVLETADIERMRRFARLRSFRAGEVLARAGQVADGLTIILAGKVEISRHDKLADHEPMAVHGPGQFMGELAQLAGRPGADPCACLGARRGADHRSGATARDADR